MYARPHGSGRLKGRPPFPARRGRTNLGRAIAYGILREVERDARHKSVYQRIQAEAAARPGSVRVDTPRGPVWMSPIEHALHEAMAREGLAPVPQLCIQGYYVDFAFPDVRLAVEADGAAHAAQDRADLARVVARPLEDGGLLLASVPSGGGPPPRRRTGCCIYAKKP